MADEKSTEVFTLKVVTPDGVAFDGDVRSIIVRTSEGDIGILPGHTRYVATIGYGKLTAIFSDGSRRSASCMNGFVSVSDNLVRVIVTTFEFSDCIDLERAKKARERAEARMAEHKSEQDYRLAEAKLKRALIRINVGMDAGKH